MMILNSFTFKFLLILLFFLGGEFILAQVGANLGLGKPVTGSSTVIGNASFSVLTDGDTSTGTRTNSTQVSPSAEWVQIDLGSDQFIEHLKISSLAGFHAQGRRFMIVTWPSLLGASGLGDQPSSYLTGGNSSAYNRLAYTSAAATGVSNGNLVLGGAVPGAANFNLGPDYTTLTFNVGIHKARYIRILNLQDTDLALSEIEVYGNYDPIQRNLVNTGFESPSSGLTTHEGNLLGWSTTEVVAMTGTESPNNDPSQGGFIEIWNSGFIGVVSPEGSHHCELNAFTNGELSQYVCVLPGETFSWSFAHRGRLGVDVMRLKINDIDVAEFSDNSAGGGTHTGTVLTPSTTTGGAGVAIGGAWYRYSGTWKNTTGSSITAAFAFRAVSSSGGNIGTGNFLDDIKVTSLSSLVSLESGASSGAENISTANLPKLLITGIVPAGGATVQLSLSGTATRGTDYTTNPAAGNITVTIPAGTYNGTSATGISLAPYIQVNADTVTDPDETIIITMQNPSSNLVINTGQACMAGFENNTYTILDTGCFMPAVSSGTALSTPYGITSLGRAGMAGNNWPMVRKGGWAALESKTKAFVPNRLTDVQILAIPDSDLIEGMMVYNITLDCLQINIDGTPSGWKCFSTPACPQ